MDKSDIIISEYEELVKIKEFHRERKIQPLECTYQAIIKALKQEYSGNITEKLDRWITVTNARYFKQALPVVYYFQAKMLFRDGYYEAAITVSRSICEMICYDHLKKQSHPFGNYEQMELENFRTLVKYLAIPKSIPKDVFENDILPKVQSTQESNLIKSSYNLDRKCNQYNFKIENGKEARNLNKLYQIFEDASYNYKENFPDDTFNIINRVYDDGNTYVHARKSKNRAKIDAASCLNRIGKVLAYLYIVNGSLVGKKIVTGYSYFPNICQGVNFAMDVYFTPDDALRGYYNLPSQQQINQMFELKGEWKGEWKLNNRDNENATLNFIVEGEYLRAYLIVNSLAKSIRKVDIKLFGNYFHLIAYDEQEGPKENMPVFHFELEILNGNTLVGDNLINNAKTVFVRIN